MVQVLCMGACVVFIVRACVCTCHACVTVQFAIPPASPGVHL